MSIYLHNVDFFENREEGILLTIDGAAKGMEGNIQMHGKKYKMKLFILSVLGVPKQWIFILIIRIETKSVLLYLL